MTETGEIKLTVNELAASLSLCGYESIASQIINDHGLVNGEEQFSRFVQETETSLTQKGYWDSNQKTGVARGLEDLLYLLVHAKKKIRSINMQTRKVLIIHFLNKDNILVQQIEEAEHRFSFPDKADKLSDLLRTHYDMPNTDRVMNGWQPLQLSEQLVDEFHTSPAPVVQAMADDLNQPASIRHFASDFLRNGQEFNNISFMESNYVKDHSEFDNVQFFVPGDHCIWHMDYDGLEKNQHVMMQPVPVNTYFEEVQNAIYAFFGISQ
ncbi:hypothetical protein GLW20_09890 [Virgibacillus halodenitrificans]|nr:hypothetical protein [Virgibacillus halodenitrificans]